MQTKFVRVLCDVTCEWQGVDPQYRVLVNQELFAERTWIWGNEFYLEEAIQLNAPLGRYRIEYELVDPKNGALQVSNIRIESGDARLLKRNTVEIY